MRRVITYGTFDLLHKGHIALLERARSLGDYLIVGVTSDQFDRARGKLDVCQSTIERVEAVKETGLADLVIIEEYEGQKIEDIKRLGVDVFTVGSDWRGHFDYLSRFCDVVYLDRTEGVSSTQLRRAASPSIRVGVIGDKSILDRFGSEIAAVNGMEYMGGVDGASAPIDKLLEESDAVVVASDFSMRSQLIDKSLRAGKHVLYVPPSFNDVESLARAACIARQNEVVLFNGLKTKYYPAFQHLLLLVESGAIGEVRAADISCSQVPKNLGINDIQPLSGAMEQWGGIALLPALELFGGKPDSIRFRTFHNDVGGAYYTRCSLEYGDASVQVTMGRGIKTEGDMVITGTKGYVYVPSPWWLTDYFEVRSEDLSNTRKYYWGYEGEGLRYELLEFMKRIRGISSAVSDDDEWYARVAGLYFESENQSKGDSSD